MASIIHIPGISFYSFQGQMAVEDISLSLITNLKSFEDFFFFVFIEVTLAVRNLIDKVILFS
jgi:hypothetical protein